jgi:hypothetical protein
LPTTPPAETLAERRYVTVVVRLVLDRRKLVYGEVVDVSARPCGRFDAWRDLARAVRACAFQHDGPALP